MAEQWGQGYSFSFPAWIAYKYRKLPWSFSPQKVYCQVVDLRTVTFDVPPQKILTKDSVTVAVDAVVYYKVLFLISFLKFNIISDK